MSRKRSPRALLRAIGETPGSIPIGHDPKTGELLRFPLRLLNRNNQFVGETGAGKSVVIDKIVNALAFTSSPIFSLDYAGTGVRHTQDAVSTFASLLAIFERLVPETRHLLARPFAGRYAFVNLSHRAHNGTAFDLPVMISLLKRRRIGTAVESVAEVVDRVIRTFDARFEDDLGIRVQFLRVVTAIVAALAGADQPINRWADCLTDPDYLALLRREHERLGTAADAYLQTQMRELAHLHALRGQKSTYAFDEATKSTVNALQGYRPGTLLGEFFSGDSFDVEQLVFGAQRLFVTSDVSDPLLKREAFNGLYALLGSLIDARASDPASFPRLLGVIDEVGWLKRQVVDHLAMNRNLRTTLIVAHQANAQWEHLGLKYVERMTSAIFPLQVVFRPPTLDDAKHVALLSEPIDPMGMLFPAFTKSSSATRSFAATIGETWNEQQSEGEGSSAGLAASMGMTGDTPTSGQTTNDGTSYQSGSSRGTGGSSSETNGDSTSEGIAEVLFRIAFDEQVSIAAQKLLRRPQYEATFLHGGRGVAVALAPPHVFPSTILGVDTRGAYLGWHDQLWRSRQKDAPTHLGQVIELRRVEAPIDAALVDVTPIDVTPADVAPVPPPVAAAPGRVDEAPKAPDGERTSPSSRPLAMSSLSANTKLAALTIAAWIRYPTIHNLMLLTQKSYDASARLLDRLAEDGHFTKVRQPVGKSGGSTPVIYLLTETGARAVAEGTGFDLGEAQHIARSLQQQRRSIEEGHPTLVGHQRYAANLLTLLLAYIRSIDPEAVFHDVAWDLPYPVDVATAFPRMSKEAVKRLDLQGPGTETVFRPDISFVAEWKTGPDQKTRREPFILEIETGFGEQPFGAIGQVKGARMLGLQEAFKATHTLSGETFALGAPLRTISWVRNPADERRYFKGVYGAVPPGTHLPLLVTNGALVPLSVGKDVPKKDLPAHLASLVASLGKPVFRLLRDHDTAERCALFPWVAKDAT